MTINQYDPEALPKISSVKVFVFGAHIKQTLTNKQTQQDIKKTNLVFNIDGSRERVSISKSFTVSGKDATTICELWRQLPTGKQARCHMPPFGLHFMSDAQIHTVASICWQCNNIYLQENGKNKVYEFDGKSRAAQQLFQLLTKLQQD